MTCNVPICTTCSQAYHPNHDCCELDEQAEKCKIQLEVISRKTQDQIYYLKQVIEKNKCQVQNVGTDFDYTCNQVKFTFK